MSPSNYIKITMKVITKLYLKNLVTMNIKRMRKLATKIFKTFNNLNSPFLKEIFKTKVNSRVRPNDIIFKTHNTATYGNKSLTVLEPKIWNSSPENTKSESSYKRY